VILVEIAAYILFITLILFYSTRVLWLFFLLFSYRFWESVLTYDLLSKYIHFSHDRDYYIVLIIVSVLSYFIVMAATQSVEFLRYILLLAMALYVLRQPEYGIKEVLMFKDYLEAHGMWNLNYWGEQVKNLFKAKDSDILGIFERIADSFVNFFKRLHGYIQNL